MRGEGERLRITVVRLSFFLYFKTLPTSRKINQAFQSVDKNTTHVYNSLKRNYLQFYFETILLNILAPLSEANITNYKIRTELRSSPILSGFKKKGFI